MSAFDSYIGAYVLGTLFNLFLTGINWSQMIEYMRCTGKERPIYTAAVYTICFVAYLHTGTSIATIYIMVVHNFGNVAQFASCPWPFALDPITTAIIAFIAQAFFSYRVYIISGRKMLLPGFILLLTLLQLAIGAYCTAFAFAHPAWVEIATIKWAVALWLFLMAFVDVIITAAIVYYLNRAKTGFEQTNSVIDKLVKHIIANNALTAVAASASAILFVCAPGVYHVIPGLIISKFYVISLLASLNSRARLTEDLNATRAQGNRAYTSGIDSGMGPPGTPRVMAMQESGGHKSRRPHLMRAHSSRSGYGADSLPIQVTIDSTCEFDDDREQWDSDKSTGGNVGAGGGRAGGGGERLSLPPPNNSPPFQVMSLAVPDNLRGPPPSASGR